MATAMEFLQNGSVFTAVYTMYFSVMSYWWVILILLFTLFITQIGIKNEAVTGFVGILGCAFLLAYLPVAIHWIFYLIIVLCVAMVLYKFAGPDN